IDTSVLRQALAAEYGPRPQQAVFDASLWQHAPFAEHDLRMVPAYSCALGDDHEVMRQAALAVERAGHIVDGGPIARFDPALCGPEPVTRSAGAADGQWLELVLEKSLQPAVLRDFTASGACMRVDRGQLCGPASIDR
ncbi:MAG: hypothetical protein M3N26_09425, partial [Pseudomonadota bacterium]|nr:hypothetical protein [Pseudomonadota bacterium]